MTQTIAFDPAATERLAARHGFSAAAVAAMIAAQRSGLAGMALFDHPEFGGPGQWMRGGMVMLSGGNDPRLRARVDALCEDIALEIGETPAASVSAASSGASLGDVHGARSTAWWPAELGAPNAAGSQNGMRYAYFAAARRLAVDRGAGVAVYDTGAHSIVGVSQQQTGGQATLTLNGAHGPIELERLARVDTPAAEPARAAPDSGASAPGPARREPAHDVFDAIERLGVLRDKGLLTEDEFAAQKTELLARL